MDVIAFCGFAGQGKGTSAEVLVERGYVAVAFADGLKDATAALFGWPRPLLEGDTDESRTFRETVDPWWADNLSMPGLTPRWVLQHLGTDVLRNHFHPDIHMLGVHRKLRSLDRAVLTDCRFPNELAFVKRIGGRVFRVSRGPEPAFWDIAVNANKGDAVAEAELATFGIHKSETAWIGCPVDGHIHNDGTREDLRDKVLTLLA